MAVRLTTINQEAVAETLAELARRGVTFTPATVEDTIERNVQAMANQLGQSTEFTDLLKRGSRDDGPPVKGRGVSQRTGFLGPGVCP